MCKISDLTIAKKIVNTASSAADRGIHFDLSFKRTKQLLNTKRCYYSNVILEKEGPNQLTLERVDNNVGYIDSNVIACSKIYNSLKSNHPDIMFINIAKGILKHQKKNKNGK